MRASKLFFPTMREVPGDASITSHKLMLRAGLIRKVAAGIYTYLPMGLRVLKKISNIIQEEMNKKGAQELLLPMVQPKELWEESGRYNQYGPELLRFQDRKESWFCLGPTHEEVICNLVRDHVTSYKNLPLNLYQIQTKFRDEIRPRFGLMRGREFLMKDGYSFCQDKKNQEKAYQDMWDAYHEIFTRCGLDFRAVRAATGAIGGDLSHEFQVLAQSGEDAIASCTNKSCNYAANTELAKIKTNIINQENKLENKLEDIQEINTPGVKSVEQVSKFLKTKPENILKSIIYDIDGKIICVLVLGCCEISEAKLKNHLKADIINILSEKKTRENIGEPGFIGPIRLNTDVKIIADNKIKSRINLIAGANKLNTHISGVCAERDIRCEFADLRTACAGDLCGECGSEFEILRGIEVGHIFSLGQKYSKPLGLKIQDEHGESKLIEMGTYGIGVGRTAAAAIEQNHDDKGIIWPKSIAPYHINLVQMGIDAQVTSCAQEIYEKLTNAGLEVLFDDRNERAGVKLNDADLIGCPIRIMIGKRGLEKRQLELVKRANLKASAEILDLDGDYVTQITNYLADIS